MAAIDDLTKAVTDLTSAVGSAVTEMQTLAASIGGGANNDPAIEAAATQLETLASNLQAAVTAAGQAVSPPAPASSQPAS